MNNLTPLFHLVDVAFTSVQPNPNLTCFCCSHSVFPVLAVMRIRKMLLAPGQAWQRTQYKHIFAAYLIVLRAGSYELGTEPHHNPFLSLLFCGTCLR